MKKIGIIGQFPLPMHGLSKALDTLYNSNLNEKFELNKINITDNKKFLTNLAKIMFSNLDLYYLTISQSKLGNLRDIIIIKLIQLKKKKIIIHLHGGGFRNILDNEFSRLQRHINYKVMSKVNAGIVLGESLKYIFDGIIPNENLYVVKNCVDDEFIISEDEFSQKMINLNHKKEFNILYLSNFIEAKGYKEVLELARLCKSKNNVFFKFKFAGKFFSKDEEDEFYDYIGSNQLEEIIEYKGVVSGNEKLSLFRESDIFILLTRYKNEGQPISIIEAAANGLKILSTNHAGIKDILDDSEMIVVNKHDIDVNKIYVNLMEEIESIDTDEFIKIRGKMINEFSQEKYLKNLENIFNEI